MVEAYISNRESAFVQENVFQFKCEQELEKRFSSSRFVMFCTLFDHLLFSERFCQDDEFFVL